MRGAPPRPATGVVPVDVIPPPPPPAAVLPGTTTAPPFDAARYVCKGAPARPTPTPRAGVVPPTPGGNWPTGIDAPPVEDARPPVVPVRFKL